MGRRVFTEAVFRESVREHAPAAGPVTRVAEQNARETGRLDPLVDPAGYGVIRLSLPRFELQPNGLWLLTVGTPMPVETRVDTTGSMGGNVDVALAVLPTAHRLVSSVLPGYDLQIATGIFGDQGDRFILCRPQFEMEADKIVRQLTLMVPERDGGDTPEDPDYGIFGAAYLTNAYANRIGLKGYDFTVTDAPGRGRLDERNLTRVFGTEVFAKVTENGQQAGRNPHTAEVVNALLARAHAFVLQVGGSPETTQFWVKLYGRDRVVTLPDTRLLPHVQAAIIGLTEGTLALDGIDAFLKETGVGAAEAKAISRSVANVPLGVQAALPNFAKRPRAGDLFREKTDLWPLTAEELAAFNADKAAEEPGGKKSGGLGWL